MEEKKIFIPHELKTIEIDTENKIFRVNGEDFGRRCTGFSIDCSVDRNGKEFFKVDMAIKTTVKFANYDRNGNKTSEGERHLPESDAACAKKLAEIEKTLSIFENQIRELKNQNQQLRYAVVLGKMPQF